MYSSSASLSLLSLVICLTTLTSSWSLSTERKPWDIFRFAQQSSKFVNPPFNRIPETMVRPGDVLWRLGDDDRNKFSMAPLDDVVMGGASASTFEDGTWKGTVTDANRGGFIGLRSAPTLNLNMKACRGVEWKVKLLNTRKTRRFKFVTRDSTDFNGITWTTINDVRPGYNAFRINFEKQVPAVLARTQSNKTFNKESVAAFQLAYSKFEYDGFLNEKFLLGDIEMQLLELRAY
ncbi:hypothetical protein MPSEU_000916500 [Mayamaea pseudoterrestris]|nr:hypothetical protein MPSEU_000916500 [Mayamaea pseudoterrestris]